MISIQDVVKLHKFPGKSVHNIVQIEMLMSQNAHLGWYVNDNMILIYLM